MKHNGIILINKNHGSSSNKILQYIKHFYKIKKIGFSGTLDPFATGLLVILIGQATKLSDCLTGLGKAYIYNIKTNIQTDSLDFTGKIIQENKNIKYKIWNKAILNKTINHFNNKIYEQTIPIYSAMKYKGKALYKYARNNQKINKKFTKKVHIYENKLLYFNEKEKQIKIYTKCSKGTFIRTIAEDICTKLNIIGHVSQLKRLEVGPFHINNSWHCSNLPSNIEDILIPMRKVITLLNYKILNYEENINCDNIKKYLFINYNKKYIFGFYKKELRSIYKKMEYRKYIYKCIKRFEK